MAVRHGHGDTERLDANQCKRASACRSAAQRAARGARLGALDRNAVQRLMGRDSRPNGDSYYYEKRCTHTSRKSAVVSSCPYETYGVRSSHSNGRLQLTSDPGGSHSNNTNIVNNNNTTRTVCLC